jgi:transcriptional regulator GlxA family with amidase domain
LSVSDVPITPQATPEEAAGATIVCVPELAVPPSESLEGRFAREIAWLRRCYAAGATIATACSGAVLLAEGGLLDGLEATTHWAYCDVMRSRYPAVKVRKERALVVSGDGQRLVMAGGGTPWQDVACT